MHNGYKIKNQTIDVFFNNFELKREYSNKCFAKLIYLNDKTQVQSYNCI